VTVAGLRKVSWVSVTAGASRPVAEAHGIGHRHPAVVRISLRTANALQRAGVPLVLRQRGA
jgi:hypothetical protein